MAVSLGLLNRLPRLAENTLSLIIMRLKFLLRLICLLVISNGKTQNLMIEAGWLILPDSTSVLKQRTLEIKVGKIYTILIQSKDTAII